jgi:hypothetical protein
VINGKFVFTIGSNTKEFAIGLEKREKKRNEEGISGIPINDFLENISFEN